MLTGGVKSIRQANRRKPGALQMPEIISPLEGGCYRCVKALSAREIIFGSGSEASRNLILSPRIYCLDRRNRKRAAARYRALNVRNAGVARLIYDLIVSSAMILYRGSRAIGEKASSPIVNVSSSQKWAWRKRKKGNLRARNP